jgi:(p)ppGpp synthase/HD superfamily hydrolase
MTKEQAIQIYLDNLKKADPDTILIKMCDRLHNLRSLSGTTLEKQIRTCKETKEKYFSIFELVKEKYPNQYQYLINQMNQEIAKFIS